MILTLPSSVTEVSVYTRTKARVLKCNSLSLFNLPSTELTVAYFFFDWLVLGIPPGQRPVLKSEIFKSHFDNKKLWTLFLFINIFKCPIPTKSLKSRPNFEEYYFVIFILQCMLFFSAYILTMAIRSLMFYHVFVTSNRDASDLERNALEYFWKGLQWNCYRRGFKCKLIPIR